MAKQQLNRTEVGTAFEQIDRKRVTQGMRRDRPGDARSLLCLLANPFNGVPRDRLPGPSPGNNHSLGWVSFQYSRRMSNNLGESIT
jgi:hypothetical protein